MDVTVKNGYRISSLTLGTVQLGLAYGINNSAGKPDFQVASEILDTALSSGIVSFDTAQAYGESEAVLRRYFDGDPREKTLITKVLFYDADPSQVQNRLFSMVRESAKRLGLEKIPFLKLHNQEMLERYGDTLVSALHELKREGLVGGVGVSFSDKSRLLELSSGCGFDCIQLPANVFDHAVLADGSVERLSREGSAIFIRSVFLQGLFFKDPDTLPEKLAGAAEPLRRLRALAREADLNLAQLAITFLRDAEGVTSLILGCDTPAQLRESISLFGAPKIRPEIAESARRIAESVPPIVIRPWEWA